MSLTLLQLSPETSGELAAALRTWAPVIASFYDDLIACRVPADLATGAVIGWWEQTVAAGYEMPEVE